MSLARAALRALHDCGCVRVPFDHDGYLELADRGLASIRPVDDDEDALDFRLSDSGKVVASAAFSYSVGVDS